MVTLQNKTGHNPFLSKITNRQRHPILDPLFQPWRIFFFRLEPKIKQSEVNFFSHAQNLLSALCQNHCSKPNCPLFKYWPNCVLSAFCKASWWKFLRPIFPIVVFQKSASWHQYKSVWRRCPGRRHDMQKW